MVTLSIQRVDDFIETHEITDEWQIFPMADPIRMRECAGDDVAEFLNIAHVNTPHVCIERKSPAQGSVGLLLGSQSAKEVLVVKRRDDKRVMREAGVLNDPIDVGLAGKVANVELAAADR